MPFGYTKQPVKAVISVVTGTRAIDGTVYQNTKGRPLLCILTVGAERTANNERAHATAYVENATPPTQVVAAAGLYTGTGAESYEFLWDTMVFGVPNEDYYKVDVTVDGGSAVGLVRWIEVEL